MIRAYYTGFPDESTRARERGREELIDLSDCIDRIPFHEITSCDGKEVGARGYLQQSASEYSVVFDQCETALRAIRMNGSNEMKRVECLSLQYPGVLLFRRIDLISDNNPTSKRGLSQLRRCAADVRLALPTDWLLRRTFRQ